MTPGEHLARVSGLARTRALIDDELLVAVREADVAGIDRTVLARMAGINRATLYRRYFPPTRGGQGRPKAGEADP